MTIDQARRTGDAVGAGEPEPDAREIISQIGALLQQLVDAARTREANPDSDCILTEARRAFDASRERERVFGQRLFGDPSWDMLLDLFIAQLEERKVSVSSACIAASAPTTTALRHIAHLTQLGLVSRQPHPSDARSIYLAVTAEGTAKLTTYFSWSLEAGDARAA